MLQKLWNDEVGAILSAELVLISTILVIGLIVGLVELQTTILGELCDVGNAIGSLNQSYQTTGAKKNKLDGSVKAVTHGSVFRDFIDDCDNQMCAPVLVCEPTPEPPKP